MTVIVTLTDNDCVVALFGAELARCGTLGLRQATLNLDMTGACDAVVTDGDDVLAHDPAPVCPTALCCRWLNISRINQDAQG
ncbi:MAG: hypothetical protein KGL35_19390, partial [Bradyrhizobium sp.]|nr:hypothetical protein [Bradyrhizobium sp.]